MRRSVIFTILWSLLLLGRVGDALYSYGQLKVARGLESLYTKSSFLTEKEEETLEQIVQGKEALTERTVIAGLEIVLLGGIFWVFFKGVRRAEKES